MTGSFRLRIGIISVVGMISVVIGGHFGGGDHFDGGDHFGGGTPTIERCKHIVQNYTEIKQKDTGTGLYETKGVTVGPR